jgi:glycerol uptake facilitator-like aquaporin
MNGQNDSRPRWLRILSGWCFAIILGCFLTAFALDSRYVNNPLSPVPSEGKVYPHPIKLHGTVYLSESEEAPYRWLFWIGAMAAALLLVTLCVKPPGDGKGSN